MQKGRCGGIKCLCDPLDEYGWFVPDFGDQCNVLMCDEGDDEDRDVALVSCLECGADAACALLEFEPCQKKFDKVAGIVASRILEAEWPPRDNTRMAA